MKLITQPKNSKCCGQACIAMIAGISLEESIKVFGHNKATRTIDLIKALKKLKFKTETKRLQRYKNGTFPIEGVAIVKLSYKTQRQGHWIVEKDGKVFDPSPYRDLNNGICTSYLKIVK